MKLTTQVKIKDYPYTLGHKDRLLLLGSCFSDNIGQYLRNTGFSAISNPAGIQFNSHSLCEMVRRAYNGQYIQESELRQSDDMFFHWNFQKEYSNKDPERAVLKMNKALEELQENLTGLSFCIVTLGTSFVYKHNVEGNLVANCHKIGKNQFQKLLLQPKETAFPLVEMIEMIRGASPKCQIILTVSPVRHLKDGLIENNRSKAHLIAAAHMVCEHYEYCHYFPAYELMIDELRDYRFYDKDMLHPSALAIEYIFSKFTESVIKNECFHRMQLHKKLYQLENHRIINSDSEEHEKYLLAMDKIRNEIKNLDLS